MSASISLRSAVIESDGLLRRVRLHLAGDASELAQLTAVEYDLGPTFSDRYRSPDIRRDDWRIVVDAFGSFTASVTVSGVAASQSDGGQDLSWNEVIVGSVELPDPVHEEAAERSTPPAVRSAPWSGVALEFVLGGLLFSFAVLVLVVWPDGTIVGLDVPIAPEARLSLLAAAAGGLGALLQAALALARSVGTRSLSSAWIRWYLMRPIPGMVLGTLAYFVARAFLLSPGADPEDVAPWGVAALGLVAGYASARTTTRVMRVVETLLAPVLAEPATSIQGDSMASAPSPAESAPSRGQRLKENIARAELVLRGGDFSPNATYALADALKKDNEFGYARKLLGRIRAANDYSDLPKHKGPVKVGQQHALCTYKDPDLPAVDRFERALEILDAVDRLKKTEGLEIAEEQESLGLRGAVYKRWWQVGGQRAHLENALGCYMRGFERGPEHDYGYTGINAALVLDFLAREDAGHASSDAQKKLVGEQSSRARSIRRQLTQLLPTLPPAKDGEQDEERKKLAWLRTEWWFYATIAEAHFGLGEYDQAIQALREFNTELGLGHGGPPVEVEKVAPWEFESTITQLRMLADLQADLAERPFYRVPGDDRDAKKLREDACSALRSYLGDLAPGLDTKFAGKVGLALSGGGFRASLFHIGVLAHLAERDALRLVEVLSCVSGGSIVGAQYYLEVKRLLEDKPEREITREDYLVLVAKLERDFLAGVETNIRGQVFSSIWANLRAFFQPGYTTTRRLGALYESELYSRVQDGRGDAPRFLRDLFVQPKGEPIPFKPKYDNWRRAAKVPMLVLNATTLNTGHNWQFTASWMGEPPSRLDSEIEANYRLRRMYHAEAPRLRDKWRRRLLAPFAPPDYQQLRLGDAVAASSSVPGLFEPLVLPDLYDGKTVSLVDGGVYDNQGVASLLEQDCNVMLVSDASGQMAALDQPSGSRLGVPLRSFSVSMARVRQSQFQELDARRSSGLLKGLLFVHLKKDLDVDPVDWRECQDPHAASDDARPVDRRGVLTRYGVQKNVQRLLAGIRTDLDSFTEVEAFALMTSGYRMAEVELRKLQGFHEAEVPKNPWPWRFLQIERALQPGPGYDQLMRQLEVASMTMGKVWLLWRPLTVVASVLALAALAGVVLWWIRADDRTLVTLYGLRWFLLVTVLTLFVPTLVRLVRYRQTFRNLGLRALGAALLALGFKIHLLLFDPLFIRLGRVRRFRR